MKEKIDKISNLFKVDKLKNDKRVVVFLVCLLIATVLWFLNALGKEYSTNISYPVKYINPPKNQFLSNTPPDKLELKVQAHGFTLLRHKLSLSFSPIILNLSDITEILDSNDGSYRVYTSNLQRKVSSQISNEITIINIQPEYFRIKLDSLITRKIPVHANIDLQFKPQFDLKKPPKLSPSEIQITGPATILDTIAYISTKFKSFEKLDSDIEELLELSCPDKTKPQNEKVSLSVLVEKFTEKQLKVPVVVQNKPEGVKIKLFPSEINLTFNVGLSKFESINASDFNATVDFTQINSGTQTLDILLETPPSYIKMNRFSPEVVEFLIETN